MLTEIIHCPNCLARYVVPQAMLPAPGRTVRCRSCSHSWFEARAGKTGGGFERVPAGERDGAEAPAPPVAALENVRRLLRDERGSYDAFAHRPPFQPQGLPYRLIFAVVGCLILAAVAVFLLWKLVWAV